MPAHDIIGTSACTAHQLTITKSEKTSSPGIVLENSMHTGPGGQTAVVVVEVDPDGLCAGVLKEHDRIVSVGGVPVDDYDVAHRELDSKSGAIQIAVQRPSMLDDAYSCQEVLGKGAFGVVRRAVAATGGLEVAIKTIHKEKNPTWLKNIRREVQLMRDLTHRGAVRLFDTFETPAELFLVLELCHGEDLSCVVARRGALSEDEGRHIMRQLLEVVAYLHEKGIVHRDIKPANVITVEHLEPDELIDRAHVKLVDFGLSRNISKAKPKPKNRRSSLFGKKKSEPDSTSHGGGRGSMMQHESKSPSKKKGGAAAVQILNVTKGVGSPAYQAPEIADDGASGVAVKVPLHQLAAIDVYSLGQTLYELLVGCMPGTYPKAAREAWVAKTFCGGSQKVLRKPEDLSSEARGLIALMIQVDIEKRPTAANALSSAKFLSLKTHPEKV